MGEQTAPTTEIVPVDPTETAAMVTIYGVGIDHPRQAIALATEHAEALTDVLKTQGLTNTIQGRNYVRVEGWTLLGSMLGVAAVESFTRPVPTDWREMGLDRPEGWESRYEARTRDGQIVGAANGRCMRDEGSPGRNGKKKWEDADDYAIASMAQTRATSKSLRTALGFIVSLAGFNATPAEEIPEGGVASDEPIYAEGEEPATKETLDRAMKVLDVDSLGEVAKVYRVETGIESGVPIFAGPNPKGTYIQEGKLVEIVEALEALRQDGAEAAPEPAPDKPKRTAKAKEPANA